jgi:hypothetical protein
MKSTKITLAPTDSQPEPKPKPPTAQLYAELLSRLDKEDRVELWNLLTFLDVYRKNDGVYTPAEQFIANLVQEYGWRPGMTPDSIQKEVEDFQECFKFAIQDTRRILAQYPDQFTPEAIKAAREAEERAA